MKTIDIRAELRAHIARKYITQIAAAKAWNVSGAFVSAVLKGNKQPTEAMLNDAGYKRVQTQPQYLKVKEQK